MAEVDSFLGEWNFPFGKGLLLDLNQLPLLIGVEHPTLLWDQQVLHTWTGRLGVHPNALDYQLPILDCRLVYLDFIRMGNKQQVFRLFLGEDLGFESPLGNGDDFVVELEFARSVCPLSPEVSLEVLKKHHGAKDVVHEPGLLEHPGALDGVWSLLDVVHDILVQSLLVT